MTFYHGTSDILGLDYLLLPPNATNTLSEKGRNKNLDKVFFTKDIGSAKIYAGRACRQFGGKPIVFRVIPMSKVECINATPGTTVYTADWAFIEKI